MNSSTVMQFESTAGCTESNLQAIETAVARSAAGDQIGIRAASNALHRRHRPAQLWQLVKMPVPRDESKIVFYGHCSDPQIVIWYRRTGAFELFE